MPENSLIGWRTKIADYCEANGIEKSKGQIKRMACQISKRMADMNEELDFYTALRILGLSSDTTARDAVIPRAVPTRHISTRLPGEALTA